MHHFKGMNKKLLLFTASIVLPLSLHAVPQNKFEEVVCDGIENFHKQSNPIFQSRLINARKNALKKLFHTNTLEVKNWKAKVYGIDAVGSDYVSLELVIGCRIQLGTWNNSFSDYLTHSLININSQLADTISNLTIGDEITIDGSFYSDNEKVIYEKSITDEGYMVRPEYLFRFEKIMKIRSN